MKEHPIIRSSSCLAETERASSLFGKRRFRNASLISFFVMALKCARNTVYKIFLKIIQCEIQCYLPEDL